MPTTEENVELIETIKNPEKYYRIVISGYGAETTFTKVSKEVHDYWEQKDNDELVEYCISPDEQSVDSAFDFLYDKKRDMYQMWFDNDAIVQNLWGAAADTSCTLTVEQVVNNDHDADIIKVIKDNESIDLDEYHVEAAIFDDDRPEYLLEFASVEKGTFFDVTIMLTETFDASKLEFVTEETLSGEDFITGVKYNGNELENWGGDTNGKGYFAQMFEN